MMSDTTTECIECRNDDDDDDDEPSFFESKAGKITAAVVATGALVSVGVASMFSGGLQNPFSSNTPANASGQGNLENLGNTEGQKSRNACTSFLSKMLRRISSKRSQKFKKLEKYKKHTQTKSLTKDRKKKSPQNSNVAKSLKNMPSTVAITNSSFLSKMPCCSFSKRSKKSIRPEVVTSEPSKINSLAEDTNKKSPQNLNVAESLKSIPSTSTVSTTNIELGLPIENTQDESLTFIGKIFRALFSFQGQQGNLENTGSSGGQKSGNVCSSFLSKILCCSFSKRSKKSKKREDVTSKPRKTQSHAKERKKKSPQSFNVNESIKNMPSSVSITNSSFLSKMPCCSFSKRSQKSIRPEVVTSEPSQINSLAEDTNKKSPQNLNVAESLKNMPSTSKASTTNIELGLPIESTQDGSLTFIGKIFRALFSFQGQHRNLENVASTEGQKSGNVYSSFLSKILCCSYSKRSKKSKKPEVVTSKPRQTQSHAKKRKKKSPQSFNVNESIKNMPSTSSPTNSSFLSKMLCRSFSKRSQKSKRPEVVTSEPSKINSLVEDTKKKSPQNFNVAESLKLKDMSSTDSPTNIDSTQDGSLTFIGKTLGALFSFQSSPKTSLFYLESDESNDFSKPKT